MISSGPTQFTFKVSGVEWRSLESQDLIIFSNGDFWPVEGSNNKMIKGKSVFIPSMWKRAFWLEAVLLSSLVQLLNYFRIALPPHELTGISIILNFFNISLKSTVTFTDKVSWWTFVLLTFIASTFVFYTLVMYLMLDFVTPDWRAKPLPSENLVSFEPLWKFIFLSNKVKKKNRFL